MNSNNYSPSFSNASPAAWEAWRHNPLTKLHLSKLRETADSLQARIDALAINPASADFAVRILAIELSLIRNQITQIERYGND